jgi:hypothetical protein
MYIPIQAIQAIQTVPGFDYDDDIESQSCHLQIKGRKLPWRRIVKSSVDELNNH